MVHEIYTDRVRHPHNSLRIDSHLAPPHASRHVSSRGDLGIDEPVRILVHARRGTERRERCLLRSYPGWWFYARQYLRRTLGRPSICVSVHVIIMFS